MKFARVVFSVAAVYGILVLVPFYFFVEKVGTVAPPAVNHLEFYYGFIGAALLWQFVFILIARNPLRYRPIMLIAIFEKLVYTVPVLLLHWAGKVHPSVVPGSLVDPIFGILFVIAYFRTREAARSAAAGG